MQSSLGLGPRSTHTARGGPEQMPRPRCVHHPSRVTKTQATEKSHESRGDTPPTPHDSPVLSPAALPATFKRLVARRCGSSFREVAAVQQVELRPPGPGEVLIRVTHAGINGGCETFRARGEFAFAANQQLQDFPLGAEGAGVVAALGPGAARGAAAGLAVGQLVAFNGAAAFSEYVTARAALVTCVPEGVGGAEAAALVLSGVTACVALEATARVRPGEVVAVTAAGGGTGHLAVQLAAAAGGRVVAVVGGPRKAAAVAALGAHHVIDHTAEDVVAAVRRLCPGGLDVVYAGGGGRLRGQMLECLAPEGRLLQVGYISEYPHTRGYGPGPRQATDPPPAPPPPSTAPSRATDTPARPPPAAPPSAAAPPPAPVAPQPAGGAQASCQHARAEASGSEDLGEGGGHGSREEASGSGSSSNSTTTGRELPPSAEELFWGGLDVRLGGQRVIGQIWPQDLKAILQCRRRVFDLARRGQLRVVTDQGHGRKGVEGVADAVDYMLQGGHLGKVVIEI